MTEGSDQKGAGPDTGPPGRLIDRLPTREVVDPAEMLDLFFSWVHEQGLAPGVLVPDLRPCAHHHRRADQVPGEVPPRERRLEARQQCRADVAQPREGLRLLPDAFAAA